MEWKLERSAQETQPAVLQEQEGILEGTDEDGVSESFRLLQIDVGCERQGEETPPMGNASWCSVSVARGFE